MPFDNINMIAYSNFITSFAGSDVNEKNQYLTITICKSGRKFRYKYDDINFNSDIKDIVNNCLYNYCETGKITIKRPRGLKGFPIEFLAKFVVKIIRGELKE